ncbi:MAG: formylglycine-generating enzyme family protein [Deltaproteobacteria bacterium]|nr:formylglycine-generating enzyme family protein [Deltaproteobacteria bacterium]
MKSTILAAAALICVSCLGACTVDIAGAPCSADENCPAGQYCADDHTCRMAGTGSRGGDGEDSGRLQDASGSKDGGKLDGGVDSGAGAGLDSGPDAGPDAGFDGGPDAGFDAGYDAGPVEECDAVTPCAAGICCGGGCVMGDCCGDGDCTTPGKPTCTAGHVCVDVCGPNVRCGKGFACCEGKCRQGDCCNALDCAGNPDGSFCINNKCSRKCVADVGCSPGKCCQAGPAAGSCYQGECCDDSQCSEPLVCAGGGTPNACGCTPETEAEFCIRMKSACGLTDGNDNCWKFRVTDCGACNTCKSECVAGQCKPEYHAGYRCDGADVYWFDSCGTREELKQDCTSAQPCVGNVCCTPTEKTATCTGKCGEVPDGCGGFHDCGSCQNGYECDGGTNKCACTSGIVCGVQCCHSVSDVCHQSACCTKADPTELCAAKCGIASDGCGGSYDCGPCSGCGPSPTGKGGEMCWVTSGDFWMGCNGAADNECEGDENPYHQVTVPALRLDKYEVTVAEYDLCYDAGKCTAPGTPGPGCNWWNSGRNDHPVNCASWEQARTYCEWAGKRLPSEAEWEKAARGTDGRKYPWGNGSLDCTRAVHSANGCASTGTAPVGSKPAGAGPYGNADMVGNVWEWIEDDYHSTYSGAPATGGAWVNSPRGTARVLRGGSWWNNMAQYLRSSDRAWNEPAGWGDYWGFRCAR